MKVSLNTSRLIERKGVPDVRLRSCDLGGGGGGVSLVSNTGGASVSTMEAAGSLNGGRFGRRSTESERKEQGKKNSGGPHFEQIDGVDGAWQIPLRSLVFLYIFSHPHLFSEIARRM